LKVEEKLTAIWRRPESRFLLFFVAILGIGFTVVALQPVNDAVVVPYTALVAKAAGTVLSMLGEEIAVVGCDLRSPRFAVTIYNGCNGLITSLIFVAGVFAFPASLRAKTIGVVCGLVAIQLINLLRIISLFYIGVFLPPLFDEAHIFIWQSLVILAGIALWIAWARYVAVPGRAER
jgi:exosortase H (IPTLxxWG-CTERM-specific)